MEKCLSCGEEFTASHHCSRTIVDRSSTIRIYKWSAKVEGKYAWPSDKMIVTTPDKYDHSVVANALCRIVQELIAIEEQRGTK